MTAATERVRPAATALPSTLRLGLARAGIELRQFFRERDMVVFIFAWWPEIRTARKT